MQLEHTNLTLIVALEVVARDQLPIAAAGGIEEFRHDIARSRMQKGV